MMKKGIQMIIKEDVTFQLDHGLFIPEYHFVITDNDIVSYKRTGFEGTYAIFELPNDNSENAVRRAG